MVLIEESRHRENVTSCAIFDDYESFAHLLTGIIVKLWSLNDKLVFASIILYILFILYEIIEDRLHRKTGKAKCDILEFIIGYLLADIIAQHL